MELIHWDIQDMGDLAQVYSKLVTGVPHCYPVSPEEFDSGVRERKNDRHCKELHSEKIIVGQQDGRIVGFAHAAMGEIEFSDRKKSGGLIHFLAYEPGCRPVGQAMLGECEKHLMGLGARQIWALQSDCGYPFYHLGFGNVSDRMGHLYALFCMNGYEINEGEVFMEECGYSANEPVPLDNDVEIVVRQEPGRGVLPGLVVRALRSGKEIGICESGSAGDCCRAREVQDYFFTHWLGVAEEEQGKGWGRYLLQRTRWEMQKIGYKNAVISTDWKNHRALLFYANYGYRVTDTVYGFVKKMDN